MTEETDETDETCLSATNLSGTSGYSMAHTNVGATTRGLFKVYTAFFMCQNRFGKQEQLITI